MFDRQRFFDSLIGGVCTHYWQHRSGDKVVNPINWESANVPFGDENNKLKPNTCRRIVEHLDVEPSQELRDYFDDL